MSFSPLLFSFWCRFMAFWRNMGTLLLEKPVAPGKVKKGGLPGSPTQTLCELPWYCRKVVSDFFTFLAFVPDGPGFLEETRCGFSEKVDLGFLEMFTLDGTHLVAQRLHRCLRCGRGRRLHSRWTQTIRRRIVTAVVEQTRYWRST